MLGRGHRFSTRRTRYQQARQVAYFGNPAAVGFLFDFDFECEYIRFLAAII